jgi:hypothetical protein
VNVSVELSPPSAEVFVAFRTVCGWGDISVGVSEAALRSSIVNVTCQSESGLIGMGRLLAMAFYISIYRTLSCYLNGAAKVLGD